MQKQYDFYPFNNKRCVWQHENKAIIKNKNPLFKIESIHPSLSKFSEHISSANEFFYNGYVSFHKNEVPKKWFKKRENPFDFGFGDGENADSAVDNLDLLTIHGGLTFAEIFDNGNYIVYGFDCNHLGDDENLNLQDLDYIIKLTNQMENQLRLHAKNIKHYRKLKTSKEKAVYLDKIRESAKIKCAISPMQMILFGLEKMNTQRK